MATVGGTWKRESIVISAPMLYLRETRKLLLLLFLLLHFGYRVQCKELNDRPIIGMLAMKITDKVILAEKPELQGKSYIGASYVKFIQSAGGRVVPIVDDPKQIKTLDNVLKKVNGIMLPGGEINLIDSKYYQIAKRIFKKAIELNEAGIHFPVFGICRGFQAMPVLTEKSIQILKLFESKNISLPMHIEDDYKNSKMFRNLPDDLKKVMETKDITANYHKYGIYPSEMRTNKDLKEWYKVLGTSIDQKGKTFIAAYEGEKVFLIKTAFVCCLSMKSKHYTQGGGTPIKA